MNITRLNLLDQINVVFSLGVFDVRQPNHFSLLKGFLIIFCFRLQISPLLYICAMLVNVRLDLCGNGLLTSFLRYVCVLVFELFIMVAMTIKTLKQFL